MEKVVRKMTKKIIIEEIEENCEIKSPSPIENLRPSSEELKKIKNYFNENFSSIIYSLLSFLTKDDVEKIFKVLKKENKLKEPYNSLEKIEIAEAIFLTEDDTKRETIINFLIDKYAEEQKRNFIVNLVAVIDHYMHELIIWGIVQITQNKFPLGKKYNEFSINICFLKDHFEKGEIDENYLKVEIITRLSKETYQKWNKIKEALWYILPNHICEKIASLTSSTGAIFQVENYNKIVEKRNVIVHCFDRNIKKNSIRNTCNSNCGESFNLIKKVIESIHGIVEEYDESQPENLT